MKPAPFEYVRPQSLGEVFAILGADENARVIAGGQTLVPMLAMRLARPTTVVDVLRLPELQGIRREGDGIVVGATTRQRDAERSELIASSVPLLAAALPWVGHPPTRNRGTVGGSVANADPSAEIPLVAMTLGAEILVEDETGESAILADDFFLGAMLTSVPPAGCVKAIRFPVWQEERMGVGFLEVSARRSDFAFVAAAAQVALDADGRCTSLALGIGGVGDRPTRLDVADLVGTGLDISRVEASVRGDLHASADYRRRVAVVLGVRALMDAAMQAGGSRR
jgi:CO/xanthine dehydrogenase FAD-binding subunit